MRVGCALQGRDAAARRVRWPLPVLLLLVGHETDTLLTRDATSTTAAANGVPTPAHLRSTAQHASQHAAQQQQQQTNTKQHKQPTRTRRAGLGRLVVQLREPGVAQRGVHVDALARVELQHAVEQVERPGVGVGDLFRPRDALCSCS